MPMITKASSQDSFVLKCCLSVTAARVAETMTYPLDLTEARLQIQGEQGYKAREGKGCRVVPDHPRLAVDCWPRLSVLQLRKVFGNCGTVYLQRSAGVLFILGVG